MLGRLCDARSRLLSSYGVVQSRTAIVEPPIEKKEKIDLFMETKKKYQVFVSSTYEDLQKERWEVIKALLELDCIPSGMELFPAANQDQWTLIKQLINDCDYYLVIIGGRYGSLGPQAMSYTEMEYRYAQTRRKPTIAFLHKNPDSLPIDKREKSAKRKRQLMAFRTLIQTKMVRFWSTPSELGSAVSRSLVKLIEVNPSAGWIRADPRTMPQFGSFSDFHEVFPALIEDAKKITLYFIHSRRWRENNNESIKRFLQKRNAKLLVFLPNLKNKRLIDALVSHFEDGPTIPHLIADAYRYFDSLASDHPSKVEVRQFDLYPTYSFYRFDDRIVLAMYPTTASKKEVPTLAIDKRSRYWQFVIDDIRVLTKTRP